MLRTSIILWQEILSQRLLSTEFFFSKNTTDFILQTNDNQIRKVVKYYLRNGGKLFKAIKNSPRKKYLVRKVYMYKKKHACSNRRSIRNYCKNKRKRYYKVTYYKRTRGCRCRKVTVTVRNRCR